MPHRPVAYRLACAVFALLPAAGRPARAEDAVERLMQHVPPIPAPPRPYSDFTDPLGRFMDFLAAGAFAEARAIQPQACATWRETRQTTALSGRFRVWDTEIDLDTLCPPR